MVAEAQTSELAQQKAQCAMEAAVCASRNERLNLIEDALAATYPKAECPVVHRFTPGLYIRETHMPAGSIVTSKIHKTEHPYVVTEGRVSVWTENDGVITINAPFTGITKPGTRRILVMHEDTVWTTFHPTTETDLAKIEEQLIFPHDFNQPLEAAEFMAALTEGGVS